MAAFTVFPNVQIIGGIWRGHKLPSADVNVRPTTARSRTTLFNWLDGRLKGRRCLDLFAGCGSLSLEALSRGAEHATLLEIDPSRCRRIRDNLALLDSQQRARVVRTDCRQWLSRVRPPQQLWNLVFADPPWDSETALKRLYLLCERGLVGADALLYLETAKDGPEPPEPWVLEKQTQQSDCQLRLYRLPDSS